MKTFKITLLAALISSPLAAETIDKTWELGVFGDYVKSSTNKDDQADWQRIEAGKSIGIDLQKVIDEQWNARLELAKTRYDIQNGNDTDYGTRFGLDAIYKLDDSDVYLFAGVKRFNNVKSYNAVNVGAGYSHQVSERFSVYGEAAIYRDVDYGYTDQGFKLGLKYAFGDVKKSAVYNKPVKPAVAPVVAEKDSDNDGVVDSKDDCNNTLANVKVDANGCAVVAEKTVEINLNVSFENNSSELKSTAMNEIKELADFMNEHKSTSAAIEGHSSIVGNAKYNLTLSQKRADAVRNILINKYNVEANRLSAKGFGETQLISEGTTKADHNLNRRVVAKVKTTVKYTVQK
jgi:OOP family OmpA-OmpF porin